MSKSLIACKLVLGWLGEMWRELNPAPVDSAKDLAQQSELIEELTIIESDPEVRHYMAINLAAYRNSTTWKQIVKSRTRT